ncbi:hypothetical protein CEXT_378911 [Caerostris extrusa]|uniref:Uncharacterized protein n=1 Tax=Caerostris extrusa TaxID=172846 RepID=A0AAV4QTU4_CAEEX|nr:hypothetical protein CEXT_378911 [Caerostris extrusa]
MTATNMRQIDKCPEQVQTDWILVEKGVSKEVFVIKIPIRPFLRGMTLEFPTKSILKMCVVDDDGHQYAAN